jgi:hypothetical protein
MNLSINFLHENIFILHLFYLFRVEWLGRYVIFVV